MPSLLQLDMPCLISMGGLHLMKRYKREVDDEGVEMSEHLELDGVKGGCVVVSCRVGAGNHAHFLCKSSKCFQLLR